ncbi:hypothetical protein ABH930_006377 [Kitasatospora sp. GAS204A]|nr:hypothetical protein [Kitasatospora sp. GAS204B]
MTDNLEALDQPAIPAGSWRPPGRWPRIWVTVTRHEPEQQPFGVIEHHDDGRKLLHVADRWPYSTAAEARHLAEQLRPASIVEIVGSGRLAIKPAKAALQMCWLEQDLAAHQSRPTVDDVGLDGRPRCGQPRSKGGGPCGLRAGWGTDTLGAGPCAMHGGSTEQADAERRRLAERVRQVEGLARRAERTGAPLTALEVLAAGAVLREALEGRRPRPRRRAVPDGR